MKKFLALAVAVLMVLAMSTAVFATPAATGTITVQNPTAGKVYTVYKVFDAIYEDATHASYRYTKNGTTDAFLTALQSEGSPFELTQIGGTDSYYVTLKAGKSMTDIVTFLNANVDKLTPVSSQTAADSEVPLVFNVYAEGYYFVTTNNGTAITVTNADPNAVVIDKNQGPDWHDEGKTIIVNGNPVTVNSVNYGDTVNFQIEVEATQYVGEDKVVNYYIKDTLDAGFNAATNFHVYVDGVALDAEAYTIDQNGNSFEITVPYLDAYGPNSIIKVTYDAVVNNAAVIAGNGNLNTANFTYSIGSDKVPYDEQNQVQTTTYTFAIGIEKVDPYGNPLTGAKFSVSLGNTVIWGLPTADAGIYNYCAPGTEGAVNEFEVGPNGILIIKGLAEGTYTLTETQAPAGYNLLGSSISVIASVDSVTTYTTTITTYYDADGNVVATEVEGGSSTSTTVSVPVVPVVVVNNSGNTLPETGGIGTTIFYVVGGLMMAAAVVLLATRKKMSVED